MLDPRGPRFAAIITSVVLVVVLITGSGWLALAQAVVFAVGAANIRYAPYAWIYRKFVARHLGPPPPVREPSEPVRFAQGVGFAFMTVGTAGYLAGAPVVGLIATALALAAAFLNAAFGFCLGCEMYLLLKRVRAALPTR
ncbi:DUF4395 domain-containing protein [Planosporangium flavigriseum]|uniref:Membrane protein n=1 Tax=Planosporangium flavigriseum TaxID=373681 RepID=A0A8J3LFU8_9ACTN|nr:DUF4395 domain-containing protein [Planosporangium flavigriseum]NJC63303.1 DUF4395 domain-containing protein [Planosporangium flavigriseum]GIG72578.1 membrane protein [Planosporangium flavigriseum]